MTEPIVSPDGFWQWDGQAWVPRYSYPTTPAWPSDGSQWGPPPAARKSSNGKVIGGVVAGVVALGIAFFFVLPAFLGTVITGTVGEGVAREVLTAPTGPVPTQLEAASRAEEAYRGDHGVYTGSITGLEQYGYEATDGIDVQVSWVRGTDYCLTATDGTDTYYLGTAPDTTPDTGTVSSFPCTRG